ncbi:MAG: carboxymuconolactone decarboxylase family protein [Candidatus Iainarchaeum archaeon]|uniref:Carboxymuconolactone decarboxylase family protein n=1 Tax=Candidatus Iainarchaeum sp. TaxID=3101447 RepID=A0A7T9DK06_9ARCH|nr:MAG: carboxymuconolactone decarboxylase family protein [Candidatus Diapherotrites archaeon]
MPDLYPDEYLKASEKFKQVAGPVNEAYKAWHTQAMNAGALDKKTKELIALGIACAIRCEYCIDSHTQKAKAFGATAQEVAEVIQVATIVNAGSTISYGIQALEHYDN